MRHIILKRIIDKIYSSVAGIHNELLREELVNHLLYCGKNTYFDTPFLVNRPELLSVGDDTFICAGARMDCYPQSGRSKGIEIGKRCYIGYNMSVISGGGVTIGDDVLFASNILLVSTSHGVDVDCTKSYMQQDTIDQYIQIGNGCWIGEKVIVAGNVEIGEKCIIGAGSIVTKSVPPYSICVGSPARIIKTYNFDCKQWIKV